MERRGRRPSPLSERPIQGEPALTSGDNDKGSRIQRFEFIEADALDLPPRGMFPGELFKLVDNIPYHITSLLLHAFLEGERPPELTVLLLKIEVAESVAAPPRADELPVGLRPEHLDAELVARVPGRRPRTGTECRLGRAASPPREPGRAARRRAGEPFYRVVQAGFRPLRKQVQNGHSRELPVDRESVEAALAAKSPRIEDRRPSLSKCVS